MVYTPYIWIVIAAAVGNSVMAHYIYRYRSAPSVKPFQFLMWASVLWALAYGLEISIVRLPVKALLVNLSYVCMVSAALALLALSLDYVGMGSLFRKNFLALFLPPVIFFAFAFASDWHPLWQVESRLEWEGQLPILAFKKGAMFWLFAAYSAAIGLAAPLVLLKSLRQNGLYFRNAHIVLAGVALPLIFSLLFVLKISPPRGFNWTPVSFFGMGIFYLWAISRSELLDVIPIARNMLVENIEEMMISINPRGFIVDFNRAAQLGLGLSQNMTGMSTQMLSQPWFDIFRRYSDTFYAKVELEVGKNIHELTASAIKDERGRFIGRMFIFRDVTFRKKVEAEERKQRILADALRETSEALNSTLNYDQLLEKILVHVGRVVPVDSANIALLEEDGSLRYIRFYGYEKNTPLLEEMKLIQFSLNSSPIFRKVFESGEPLIIPDTRLEPDWVVTNHGAWIRSYAVMPIRVRSTVIGFLNLDSKYVGFYTSEHVYNLRVFANQVAIAIENSRLYAAAEHEIVERKRLEENERSQRALAEALYDTAKALNSTLDYESVLEEIFKNVQRVVPTDSANIALRGEDGHIKFERFYGYQKYHLEESDLFSFSPESSKYIMSVFQTGEPVIISDTYTDPDWILHPSSAWIRSYAAMPIRIRDTVVGVLNLDSSQAGLYTQEHIYNLRAFADQVAIAIENARLYHAAQHEIVERKQAEENLRKLLRAVEQSPASIVITNTAGNIEYVNPRFCEVTGYAPEEVIGKNPRILKSGATPKEDYRALWESIQSGKVWYGEFVNKKKNGEWYQEQVTITPITDEEGATTHYMAIKEDVTELRESQRQLQIANAQLEAQLNQIQELQVVLREQAIRDPLTGLFNRRYLDEILPREVAHAQRESYPISFVMVDIDRFKRVNDTYGHAAGDKILQKLANQLLSQTRADDIVCRYGGEEFLVVLPKAIAAVCFQIAEKWRMMFQAPNALVDYDEIRATISCGIATYPHDGATVEEVIANADKALYAAKKSGRNCVVIWDPKNQQPF